jgi:hypothetical protein
MRSTVFLGEFLVIRFQRRKKCPFCILRAVHGCDALKTDTELDY